MRPRLPGADGPLEERTVGPNTRMPLASRSRCEESTEDIGSVVGKPTSTPRAQGSDESLKAEDVNQTQRTASVKAPDGKGLERDGRKARDWRPADEEWNSEGTRRHGEGGPVVSVAWASGTVSAQAA